MEEPHQDDASDQPADVRADGDVRRQREREDEVQDDQARDLASGRDAAAPLEDEERAEDPEDRAGRAYGRDVWAPEEGACRAGHPGAEVQEQELPAPDLDLENRADVVERVHVESEVEVA